MMNPLNCSSSTVTIVVTPPVVNPILAQPNNLTLTKGMIGTISLLDNDLYNG